MWHSESPALPRACHSWILRGAALRDLGDSWSIHDVEGARHACGEPEASSGVEGGRAMHSAGLVG